MKRLIWSRFLRRWILSRRAAGTRTSSKRLPRVCIRPRLEALEDRTLLSNYVVNRADDALNANGSAVGSGTSGTLRYCIDKADTDPGSTITFDSTVFPNTSSTTIQLSNGELAISASTNIQGPGSGIVTVSGTDGGKGASRVFDITYNAAVVTITGLTIAKGNANTYYTSVAGDQGGDIFNGGTLYLQNDVVTNGLSQGTAQVPTGRGGAIYNAEGTTGAGATLTLDNTIVEKSTAQGVFNQGAGEGGGVFNDIRATLIVQNGSAIVNNQALGVNGPNATLSGAPGNNGGTGAGGGIYNNLGTLEINGTSSSSIVIAGNLAAGGSGGNGAVGVTPPKSGPGGPGGGGGTGGAAQGGGVFNSSSSFTLQYVSFQNNKAVGGPGGNGGNGGSAKATPKSGPGFSGGAGGLAGNGGSAQGGGIYNKVGVLTVPNIVFNSNTVGGGSGGTGGSGTTGGKGHSQGGHGGAAGAGGIAGSASGGAIANNGGNVSVTSTTFTSSLASGGNGGNAGSGGGGGGALDAGKPGGSAAAGALGGRGGDAVGGALFNPVGNLSITASTFTFNRAFAGRGAFGGGGGTGGAGGQGNTKTPGGVGGPGGSGGPGGFGGNAQGGGFYNLVGTVTVNGNSSGTNNEASSGAGGAGGAGGTGGAGGPDTTGTPGNGGPGGVGGAAGNAGLAEGGAGGNQGGNTTFTGVTFTSNLVLTATGGTGGNGGTGGQGGVGPTSGSNTTGAPGGAGGNGGAGGASGPGFGGAFAATASNLTVTNSTFGALLGKGNQVLGGAGGVGGIGGTIGLSGATIGTRMIYKPANPTGNGGAGGQGAWVEGGALSASGSTQTIQITESTFVSNVIASGNGGAGGAGGVFSVDGKYQGFNGQGGAAGLAQGGAISLQTATAQSATLSNDLVSASVASGGIGGAGAINNGEGGSAKSTGGGGLILGIPPGFPAGVNGLGSNGGAGGSVQGVGLADVNYNLSLNSSSFGTGTGTGGRGGNGGGASIAEPWTFQGGNAAAGGNVEGGGVFVSNNTSNTLSFNASGGSASGNILSGGTGGIGGNAGGSGQSPITGGAGAAGGTAQGGGLYMLAGSKSINTSSLTDLTLSGNVLNGGLGGVGGSGYNAAGGAGGNAQGGAVFNTSLNSTSGQSSSLSMVGSTLNGNGANGGRAGNAGSGTTPNGGNGGPGGQGGNAEGAGLYNGDNSPAMVVNSTFGGGSTSVTSSNSNVLSGGRGGRGGDAGTPTGAAKNGGPGGAGGSLAGANIYNSSNGDFINDTVVYGQAIATGAGGPGGSGAGTGGLPGPAGNNGTAQAGGFFAAAGTNSVGNTIIDLNAAGPLPAPVAPTLVAGSSGGSWTAQIAWVIVTYVNANGETTGSAFTSLIVPAGGTMTIDSPPPLGAGAGAATGWYAYVGLGGTQPPSTAFYRQQAAGSPTAIGTNYTLTALPTTTGANPPTVDTAAIPQDAFGTFTSLGNNIVGSTTTATSGNSFTGSGDQINVTAAKLNLGPLQNNGGPTSTDALNGPSVAIDAGGNALVTTTGNPWYSLFGGNAADKVSATDQRGFGYLRIYNGKADVGAFESQPPTLHNQVPTITSLSQTSAVEQGGSVTLTITGSNFTTQPGATVNWGFTGSLSSYGGLTLMPTSITPTQIIVPVPASALPDEGTVNVTVSVPDGSGVTGEALTSMPTTFTINEGTSLTLTGQGNQTNNEAATLSAANKNTVQITSSDPDTTFTASGLPSGLAIDPNTGIISGTIGAYAAGAYPVTIYGTDSGGGVQGTLPFTWTVLDTNKPTLTVPASPVTNNEGVTITPLTITATDNAGNFSAVGLPTGLSISSSGVISGTIIPYAVTNGQATQTFNVTVSAKDAAGNLGSNSFQWIVNDTTPPSVNPIQNQTNNEGVTITPLSITATDADSFSISGLPGGLTYNSTTGTITGTLGAYAAGTYNVQVIALDSGHQSVPVKFTWTVNDTNTPTLTVPSTSPTNNEGDTITPITITATDKATNFSEVGLPSGLSINAGTGVISGIINPYVVTNGQASQTFNVTVSAKDAAGNVGSNSFQWAVNDSTAPTVNAIQNQVNNEGVTITPLTVTATDADSFNITGLPGGLTYNSTTGVISGTIGTYAAGSYQVQVVATDNGHQSQTVGFTWTVDDTSLPTLTVPSTQTNNEGDKITPITITATDNATNFQAIGLPTGLSMNASGVITGTIATNVVPNGQASQTFTVTVSATDAGGNQGSNTFQWVVNSILPIVPSSPPTNNEGDTITPITITTADNGTNFKASGLPSGLSINASGVISGTIGANVVTNGQKSQTFTVTVSATDAQGVVGSNTFNWIVNDSTAPTVNAIGDQSNNEGDTIKPITVSGTDADSFSVSGLPGGLTYNSATDTISGTVGTSAAGTYNVQVIALDNGVQSQPVTFKWTVNDTSAPTLTVPSSPVTNNEGDVIKGLDITATDNAGNFTASGLPSGLSINGSGVITGTIAPNAVTNGQASQTFNVTVSATDAAGNKGSNSFQWIVNDSTAPTVNPILNQTNNEGDTIKPVTVSGTDADSFSVSGLPGGLTYNSTTGTITGTLGQYAAGSYKVQVVAVDNGVQSQPVGFTWTVNDTNLPILTVPSTSPTNNEGDTITPITITATDNATNFQATGLPTGLVMNASGVISGTINPYAVTNDQASQTFNVTVSATDAAGNVGSKQFSWTVNAITQPTFTVGNQTNNEGDTVSIQTNPVGTDPGSITATGLPVGLSIDSTTGVISGTFGTFAAGSYAVTLHATRGPLSTTTNFTWTVNDSTPPALINPGTQSTSSGTTINLVLGAADADPGSFTATGLPPGLGINSNGFISGTVFAPAGTYQSTVSASDNGHVSSVSFAWVVNQTPTSVVITNVQNSYVGFVQIETVTAHVTDAAGFPINVGSVTFQVNGQTLTASVSGGVATATFVTPMLNPVLTILLNDFFSHGLSAAYSDPSGIFAAADTLSSEIAMLLDLLIFLENDLMAQQLQSLALQLTQRPT
jgi:hypothetical protein